jgi:hypothetical protein
VIVSDDAGQFNILLHALCWIHTECLIHKMLPLNETHRHGLAEEPIAYLPDIIIARIALATDY